MRKNLIIISTMMLSSFAFSQIGINTPSPASTLDINAKNATGTSTNVDGLLIPRVSRERAFNMPNNTPTSTMVYITDLSGTQTGKTVNVDTVGFYFYDGTAWIKLNPINTSTNSFIPKVVASASYTGSAILTNDGTPIFIAPTTVNNVNDGNYHYLSNDPDRYKYIVPSTGTYQLSITAGYQLVNNSGNNAFTLYAWRQSPSGTILNSIILNNVINISYSGGVSGLNSLSGSAIVRANAGDRLFFMLQVCNGCTGRYDFSMVEVTYQQLSN